VTNPTTLPRLICKHADFPGLIGFDERIYLASHSYVVIAGPDMGATTRSMTMDLEGVEAQARDISFLIGFARTLPDADVSELAVAGFSWLGSPSR
jgi:hypothetical protein